MTDTEELDEIATLSAPRIEIVLTPKSEHMNEGPFDCYMVLHVPDMKLPNVSLIAKDLPRKEAIMKILEIYTQLGDTQVIGKAPTPSIN